MKYAKTYPTDEEWVAIKNREPEREIVKPVVMAPTGISSKTGLNMSAYSDADKAKLIEMHKSGVKMKRMGEVINRSYDGVRQKLNQMRKAGLLE